MATANAGGLALHALPDDDPLLAEAVRRFVHTHLAVIDLAAAASGALGRKLTLAARSAHEVELAAAAELGSAGRLSPDGGAPLGPAEPGAKAS